MAMTLEEELSKMAADLAAISPAPVRKAVDALAGSRLARATADAVVYLFVGMLCAIFAAAFLTTVAGQGCAPAYVLSPISAYLGILGLLLFPPALVLFFLRAAGCSSKAAGEESLIVKNVEKPLSNPFESPLACAILWLFIGATSTGTISLFLSMYGSPEISDLFGDVALLCIFLCEALVYIRGAVALQRMNPKPSNMVAVAE